MKDLNTAEEKLDMWIAFFGVCIILLFAMHAFVTVSREASKPPPEWELIETHPYFATYYTAEKVQKKRWSGKFWIHYMDYEYQVYYYTFDNEEPIIETVSTESEAERAIRVEDTITYYVYQDIHSGRTKTDTVHS